MENKQYGKFGRNNIEINGDFMRNVSLEDELIVLIENDKERMFTSGIVTAISMRGVQVRISEKDGSRFVKWCNIKSNEDA